MRGPELLLIGGKPYSGKTSTAKGFITAETLLKVKHLSMGDRLRAIGQGHIPSRYAEALMQSDKALRSHDPVSKELPIGVFEEFIETEPAELIILDAFPRYPDRLDAFRDSVQRMGAHVLAVCRIDISDDVVYERSTLRHRRYDDVPEDRSFIEKRLQDYETGAAYVLDKLAEDYPSYQLDGTLPIAENVAALRDIYQNHTQKPLAS